MNSKLVILKELLATKESRFASITYTNQKGETSKYLLHLNVNYGRVLANDLKALQRIDRTSLTGVELQALDELIASVQSSINGFNPNYTKHDYYEVLTPGFPVKFHEDTLYVNAFVVKKVVIVPVEYPAVKSSAKTIAKNKMRKLLKTNKFREFRLDLTQIESVRMNGKIIEIG